jgi:hypothetical protein
LNISVSGFLPLTYTSEAPQAELHAGEYGLCKACLRIVRMIELEHTADEHGVSMLIIFYIEKGSSFNPYHYVSV